MRDECLQDGQLVTDDSPCFTRSRSRPLELLLNGGRKLRERGVSILGALEVTFLFVMQLEVASLESLQDVERDSLRVERTLIDFDFLILADHSVLNGLPLPVAGLTGGNARHVALHALDCPVPIATLTRPLAGRVTVWARCQKRFGGIDDLDSGSVAF